MLQGCTDGVAPMSLDVYLDASLERGAAAAACRLRRVCADWSEDRLGELAYASALVRLKSDLPPDRYAALCRRYEEHRGDFLARIRGRSD